MSTPSVLCVPRAATSLDAASSLWPGALRRISQVDHVAFAVLMAWGGPGEWTAVAGAGASSADLDAYMSHWWRHDPLFDLRREARTALFGSQLDRIGHEARPFFRYFGDRLGLEGGLVMSSLPSRLTVVLWRTVEGGLADDERADFLSAWSAVRHAAAQLAQRWTPRADTGAAWGLDLLDDQAWRGDR